MSIRSVICSREMRVFRHTGSAGAIVAGTMCAVALVLAHELRSTADEFFRVEQLWCFAAALVTPATAAFATMRLFAGERRDGTLSPILAAPVSESSLVAGKFRAAIRIVWLALAASALPIALLAWLSRGALRVDVAALIGSAIFLAVHSALFTALGTLCSVLSRRPAAAACGMLLACGAALAAWVTAELFLPVRRASIPFDGPAAWIADCALGRIPPMPLLAGIVGTLCLLFISVRALEAGRWR